MPDAKVSALPSFTPALTDLLYVIKDPAGTPISTMATLTAVAGVINAALTIGTSLAFSGATLNAIQDIRTSASPAFTGLTVSGTAMTLGTQGAATTKNLKIAHQEPGGANPSAYYGIQSQTFTWTNGPAGSTYYDNTGFFGWNAGLAQADEPSLGIAMESKYTNDATNFQVEIYASTSFPDGKSVRPWGSSVQRAAPHLTQTQIIGDTFFYSSSTATTSFVNFHIKEGGGAEMYGTFPFTLFNYASGASNTGKGQINIVPSDVNPAVSFLKSGAGRADIGANLTDGAIVAEVGYATGGYFLVNHGYGYIYQNSASLQAFKIQNSGAGGGDFCFFTNDGTNAKFRVTNIGDVVWGTDSGLNRISAGLLGVGTGAAGSFAGGLKMTALTTVGVVIHSNLPTSASGLVSGQLWNNSGVVNVV